LKENWIRTEQERRKHLGNGFGARLQHLRKQQGISRREIADLFGIGGKKPARIIKHIEEDGFFSAQAYPAGLAAVLAGPGSGEGARLLELWRKRRKQFHCRHRPEMRIDLRLARELYGFGHQDMEPILGYTNQEYQRIERGVSQLRDTALDRILQAIHRAGERRIEALLKQRSDSEAERAAWQVPPAAAAMIKLLAQREGGLIPLVRLLRQAGLKGLWPGRLKLIAQGKEVPAWRILERIGQACGVMDLSEARRDWRERYREQLQASRISPLGVELRLLIGEVAATLRAFSPKLGFNYSVLVRDLQRIDRDEPVKWFHVERIVQAIGLPMDDGRRKEIHALWYTASERKKKSSLYSQRRAATAAETT
jgi:transcriptional regulator with XRE-family HTH domain